MSSILSHTVIPWEYNHDPENELYHAGKKNLSKNIKIVRGSASVNERKNPDINNGISSRDFSRASAKDEMPVNEDKKNLSKNIKIVRGSASVNERKNPDINNGISSRDFSRASAKDEMPTISDIKIKMAEATKKRDKLQSELMKLKLEAKKLENSPQDYSRKMQLNNQIKAKDAELIKSWDEINNIAKLYKASLSRNI